MSEKETRVITQMPVYGPSFADRIGNPAPLALGGFATTILSVSFAMMNFRGVGAQQFFIGDLCFIACFGLILSAQWAMLKGDTFSYTVLTAYGFFYGGYGAMMIPWFGVAEAYGGHNAEYYNAVGMFVLMWAVFNTFFLIASLRLNLVYIGIFLALELCLSVEGAAYFIMAGGDMAKGEQTMHAAGAFAFISGLLGYYCVLHYFCQDVLPFAVPMGDTSRFFAKRRAGEESEASSV